MNINEHRYDLYIKRAVIQAHLNSLDEQILVIERNEDNFIDDNEDDLFRRHWSNLNGGK